MIQFYPVLISDDLKQNNSPEMTMKIGNFKTNQALFCICWTYHNWIVVQVSCLFVNCYTKNYRKEHVCTHILDHASTFPNFNQEIHYGKIAFYSGITQSGLPHQVWEVLIISCW